MSSTKLAYYLSAEKYRLAKLNQKALALYEKILEIEPNDLGIMKKMVQIQIGEQMTESAAVTWLKMAQAYNGLAQVEQARYAAERALVLYPEYVPAREYLTKLQGATSEIISEETAVSNKTSTPPVEFDTPLFRGLNDEQLESIIRVIIPLRMIKGTVVFHEGDQGNSLFIIKEGRFEIRTTVQDAMNEKKDTVFSQLGPGHFFGEFAFLTGGTRIATVTACEDAEVYQLTKEDLDEIIQKYPEIEQRLFLFYKSRALDLVLAKSSLFHELGVAERRELLELFVLRKFKAEEVIIREGKSDDSLYLIKRGEARVETTSFSSEKVLLGTLGQHQFFGEISFLTGLPRTATVIASCDCEILEIGREDLVKVIKKYPHVETILRCFQQYRADSTLKKLKLE